MTDSRVKVEQLRASQQPELTTSTLSSARPVLRDAERLPTGGTPSDSSDNTADITQIRDTVNRYQIQEDDLDIRIREDQRRDATHDKELRAAKQRIEQLQKGLDGTGPKIHDLNSQIIGWRSKYEAQCRRTHEQARLKQELLNKLETTEAHDQDHPRLSSVDRPSGILSRQSSTNDHLNVIAFRMIIDELLERLLRYK